MRRLTLMFGALLLVAAPAATQEVDLGATVTGEIRGFFGEPQFTGQADTLQLSLTVEPYVTIQSGSGAHRFALMPLFRLDQVDPERNLVDLREAYWHGIFGDTEVVIGADRVFWGVTESRHLVDVVNQTDAARDLDDEARLGQTMARVEFQRAWGRVAAMALFGFRERVFPGVDGRLRFPLPVDGSQALFPDGRRAVDLALRYSHYIGDFDVGVSVFHGTGREPSFVASDDGASLIPVYSQISQLGLDLQYTRNAWLWKLEALARAGHGKTFGAAVFGFEYTMYQVFGSATDLGLLAEYLYDGRDATAPPTAFAQGLFLGTRLALNDVSDTSLLFGVIVDLENGSVAGRVETERRLTDMIKIEIESRFFSNVARDSLLRAVESDSYAVVRIGVSL